MISIEEAISAVKSNTEQAKEISVETTNSLGYTTSENIYSSINMPPFKQSAMDGYAIHFEENINEYQIIGEIQAGQDPTSFNLKIGEGVRIFTGAAIPKGCSSVIQQEWCVLNSKKISFTRKIKNELNIRLIGEQLKIKDLVLSKGSEICPATIGLLTGVGVARVKVFSKPKIGILITGNELISVKEKLSPGKIFESNSHLLKNALLNYGYKNISIYKAKDTFKETKHVAEKAINENDVLLISGGISVGDYDFVFDALKEIGVKTIFYKVKQKPGKPLFFGKINKKAIFGLPGNPGSALTCFYIYVLRYLSAFNKSSFPLNLIKVKSQNNYNKKEGRGEFLKAKIKNGTATLCDFQNSSMLKAFVEGNSLVYLSESTTEIKKDDVLKAYLLL